MEYRRYASFSDLTLPSCCNPQKLYRFINCVELVSPHHAARELVHTLRQGQITSLFQKSVKRVSVQRNGNTKYMYVL